MELRHFLAAVVLAALGLAAWVDPGRAAGGAGADQAAQPASELELAMTIYAGGISLGTVDMDATLRGSRYQVVSNLRTSGIVNAFWKAQIQATATGSLDAKAFQPAFYDSFDINHEGKRREVSLTYADGAPPRLYADPPYSATGYEVTPAQRKGTLDPLSAVVFIVTGAGADAAGPCDVTAPVFDGRRRYDIEMHKVKAVTVKLDNGLYAGPALLCQIRYRQVAGFRPNLLKAQEKFPVIQAWVAIYPSKIGGRVYTVPLRIWADTSYGPVAVVTNSLKIDGRAPALR